MKNKEITDTEALVVGSAIIIAIFGFIVFVSISISQMQPMIFD